MPWAELTDTRCYYELDGNGETILFLPGMGATHKDWDAAVEYFQDDFSLIRPDFRGIGKSIIKPSRVPKDLNHYSSDLLELVEHLGLDKVNVVGISLGGVVAQRFAINYPSFVDKLVLISCAHKFGPYLRQMAALVAMAKWKFSKKFFAYTWEMLASSPKFLDSNPDRLELRYQEVLNDTTPKKNIIQQLQCLSESEPEENDHARISAKTLVISCEFDNIIPYCYGKDMSEEISNSEWLFLPGVGHNPVIECPEVLFGHIRNFFES